MSELKLEAARELRRRQGVRVASARLGKKDAELEVYRALDELVSKYEREAEECRIRSTSTGSLRGPT